MASFFSFASPVDVDIRLEGEDQRKQVEIKMEKDRRESCPVYFDGESIRGTVSGTLYLAGAVESPSCGFCCACCAGANHDVASQASVRVRDGKKLAHDGIKVEFVGSIGEPRSRSGEGAHSESTF
jgi:vacuolar protein sorting-associated protein 26